MDLRSLVKHVYQRHPPARKVMLDTFAATGLDYRGLETPCLLCGAAPQLVEGLRWLPTHHCAAALNYAVAKDFHEHELRHQGAIFGTARRADGLTAGLEEAAPDTLSAWLGMDMN